MSSASRRLIIACGIACAALLLLTGTVSSGDGGRTVLWQDGEVVAIRSVHVGKFLEVSSEDGRLRATATTPSNLTALFRVMVLPASMVELLMDASHTANSAQWAQRRHWTGAAGPGSGCQCSGYSNDHGFGAYCFGWEYDMQTPWCYVSDSCASQNDSVKGSFGRKYAECAPLEEGYASKFDASVTPDWQSDEFGGVNDWRCVRIESSAARPMPMASISHFGPV